MNGKAVLLNARLEFGTKSTYVAGSLGIEPQEMTCVFDLKHETKIDPIAARATAIGYELE